MRQGNLNPEIEEKLLTLQRYQEKQAKGEPFDPIAFTPTHVTRNAYVDRDTNTLDSTLDSDDLDDDVSEQSFKGSGRKKRTADEDDDDEWVLDSPRKYIKKADREKMERGVKREVASPYMTEVKKQIHEDKFTKIIVKTAGTEEIGKLSHWIIWILVLFTSFF